MGGHSRLPGRPAAGESAAVAAHAGPDGLLDLIRERVPRYFPEIPEVRDVRLTETRRRGYSDIHRISVVAARGPAREVVVKVFPEAAAQFKALAAVWPSFAQHPTWRVPRPLDCLADGSALVMEAAPGRSLQARLPWIAWGGPPLRTAEADCRRAGQWLRFYHDLVPGRTTVVDAHATRATLDESLDNLERSGLDVGLRRSLAGRLGPTLERLGDHARPASHVHGDFTADNLLVAGQRVTALDLWATVSHAVDHDIASFLNSLLLLRLTRPAPWASLGRLRRAFLEGYFGGARHDHPATTLYQVIGLADVALEILVRRRSRLTRAWLERFLAGALEALMTASGETR